MKIKSVSIKNFRGIGEKAVSFDCDDFNIVIGDNGTSKTTIVEAINLVLSSGYAASRLTLEDFYCGRDEPIVIQVYFEPFDVSIPDYYGNSQNIKCKGIELTAKKRDKSARGKAFNDLVVPTHNFIPFEAKSDEGWVIKRKTGTDFKITERQLALSYASAITPFVFYFGKDRSRQLKQGYNSSFSNMISDLNWRFEKVQRTKDDSKKFKHIREKVEKHIIENTDGDTIKKTIDETNTVLKKLGIQGIDISLLRTLTPFDNTIVVKRFDGFEHPMAQSGSGIEMIVALTFLECLSKISKEEIIIIIDEPELHLHPTLQDKLAKHFLDISNKIQIIFTTHSPLLFKNCFSSLNVKLLLTDIVNDSVSIQDARSKGFGLLKWSPSWGEICYFAYQLPTNEFHDDLYSSLQDQEDRHTIACIEEWFIAKGFIKEIKWTDSKGRLHEETLMTYIRNRIHHGDNQNRPMFTGNALKESIERMIQLIK